MLIPDNPGQLKKLGLPEDYRNGCLRRKRKLAFVEHFVAVIVAKEEEKCLWNIGSPVSYGAQYFFLSQQ